MRFITERELRDQFAGGAPERYEVPADCRLTNDDWTLITDDSTKLRAGAPSVR